MDTMQTSPNRATIVVVEQRTLLRDSFVRCLASEPDLDVVAVSKIDDFERIAQTRGVHLVILRVAESDHGETLRLKLQSIGHHGSSVPSVVLSSTEDPHHVVEALEAGVKGYITTSMPFAVVLAALRFVAVGGTFAPAGSLVGAARLPETPPVSKEKPSLRFTARQTAVVNALSKGMANKTIAHELNLCESTVKVHVRKIMRKLNATNRTQAAFLANERKSGAVSLGLPKRTPE